LSEIDTHRHRSGRSLFRYPAVETSSSIRHRYFHTADRSAGVVRKYDCRDRLGVGSNSGHIFPRNCGLCGARAYAYFASSGGTTALTGSNRCSARHSRRPSTQPVLPLHR
jgi:hypothetical protein